MNTGLTIILLVGGLVILMVWLNTRLAPQNTRRLGRAPDDTETGITYETSMGRGGGHTGATGAPSDPQEYIKAMAPKK